MKNWVKDVLNQRQVFGPWRNEDGTWGYCVRTGLGAYIGGTATSEVAALDAIARI